MGFVRSHELYGAAYSEGRLKDEMVYVPIPQKNGGVVELNIDEQYQPNITLANLAKLPPIYGSSTCTGGNSSGLNDGATAILLMSREKAEELCRPILATVVASVTVGMEPRRLPETPAKAIFTALRKANLPMSDMKLMEINKAFAAVTMVSKKILGEGEPNKVNKIRDRLNVNRGAIAIGHANTASGARIIMTLVNELRRRGGGLGIAAICGGLA